MPSSDASSWVVVRANRKRHTHHHLAARQARDQAGHPRRQQPAVQAPPAEGATWHDAHRHHPRRRQLLRAHQNGRSAAEGVLGVQCVGLPEAEVGSIACAARHVQSPQAGVAARMRHGHFDRRRRWELCGTTGSAQQNCAAGSADGPGRYFEEARAVAAAAVSACCTGFVISCRDVICSRRGGGGIRGHICCSVIETRSIHKQACIHLHFVLTLQVHQLPVQAFQW
mmetsp:Transcript_17598/g.52871  ORF Transcript_17598/g.52871 Transcript_17598/m.52871 type:complete len:226 (+) Transcript_17598:3885-4562(+)